MANNKLNKILIKPMGNAQAIASTLGIEDVNSKEDRAFKNEKIYIEESTDVTRTQNQQENLGAKIQLSEDKSKQSSEKPAKREAGKTEFNPKSKKEENQAKEIDLPLLIEIKRRLPGKELFVLSLLFVQKNKRGLVQMTVNSLMALYTSVFDDVIKDDTVRRSLKRLSDSGLIKTISIPGNNTGYVYEIKDLPESDILKKDEKDEFVELVDFVENKLSLIR